MNNIFNVLNRRTLSAMTAGALVGAVITTLLMGGQITEENLDRVLDTTEVVEDVWQRLDDSNYSQSGSYLISTST